MYNFIDQQACLLRMHPLTLTFQTPGALRSWHTSFGDTSCPLVLGGCTSGSRLAQSSFKGCMGPQMLPACSR